MKLDRLSFVLGALVAIDVAYAAPFAKWFEHRRPDGSVLRIWGEGDEYAAHFEDEAGRNLVYNPESCDYEYAPREDDETLRDRALERLEAKAEETGIAARWAVLKEKASNATSASLTLKAPPSHTTSGRIVGVTLLIDFPLLDDSGAETNTLSATAHPDVTADGLREMINGDEFNGWGNASSVRDFYARATSGHVDYTNAVIGWIKVPHPRAWYDDPRTDNGDCGRRLIGDALDALTNDPRYTSEYAPLIQQATANSSGEILALNVFFAGPEATTWSYGLWAHQYVLKSAQYKKCYVTIGGKQCHFYNYQISPVTSSPTIHTFCHESGHMICDFPDLYAYTGGLGNGIGNWCLMCGRTDDRHPQNFSAYLRVAAGWVTPQTLPATSGWVTVKCDLQDVWKYPHPTDKKQYYLIENRQATGTDVSLKGSGIVIYRCSEAGDNTKGKRTTASVFADYGYATNRMSYEVSVEQADGLYEIERDVKGHWNGDDQDTWKADNTADQYAGQFNSVSVPCARWENGAASKINLSLFSENGSTMRFWSEVKDASAVEPSDLAEAIYVNGISTKEHSSYESSSSAVYWRVTDGRIVLRGSGPYVISGTGTTPIRCAVTDDSYDKCNVVLSGLTIRSSDEDYGAFDCGTSTTAPVQMMLIGTNTLVSTAYSEKKSRPALHVTSGKTLTISGAEGAVLNCTSGKHAAGIGGGYNKGVLSVSDNASGTVRILGGTVVAAGGYNGAGIGGGNGGSGGRVDVYDAVVRATGGTDAAGIGGGYKGTAGHFFNYGGTVWAKGGAGDGSTPDIGRGKDKSVSIYRRFYVSGGSTILANGYVTGMMTPSNATERVSRVVTGNLTPGGRYVFAGLPESYGQDLIVSDANGEVHLWLPNGSYSYSGGEVDYAATVTGGKAVAAGTSEYGRWLRANGLIMAELPTADERAGFEKNPASATIETGFVKRHSDGRAITVWDEYVAGTNPTDEKSVFSAEISAGENGEPVITWNPDLNENGTKSIRRYTIYGCRELGGEWHERKDGDRFFKVRVALP